MTPAISQRGALLAKIGACLQAAQVIGLIWTTISLSQSIGSAKFKSDDVNATMAEVQGVTLAMGKASNFLFAGVGIAIVGIILIMIAATVYRYRANWFFWFLCIYGAAMTVSYMFPFGLCLLIYALMKRKEFDLDPPPAPGTMVQ